MFGQYFYLDVNSQLSIAVLKRKLGATRMWSSIRLILKIQWKKRGKQKSSCPSQNKKLYIVFTVQVCIKKDLKHLSMTNKKEGRKSRRYKNNN